VALKAILSGGRLSDRRCAFSGRPARRATLATTDGFGIYASTVSRGGLELVKSSSARVWPRDGQGPFLQPARASLVNDWIGMIRAEFPDKAKR